MNDETAWLIFGWSLLAVGWLNADSWKAIPMFLMALVIFLLNPVDKPKQESKLYRRITR